MTEVIKREIITLAEVKKILEAIPVDEMDQIQRWTFDYSKKFSKVDFEQAREMVDKLVSEGELTTEESVELVNVMPKSIEELRAFTFGWKKLIVTEKLEKIKSILLSKNEAQEEVKTPSDFES
ncbi:RNA polymerase Rpb4 [Candidatus Nitrosocosmicus franklandus]|uniref:DNA-directed RNA polymerase subunit Rpo4 n=1 Tax=Candidatus Nitrosocosmicus franklandianus TaxID=1798806 RepID=A0A484ICP1_9ARCH|nr:RNA polymerase Rpb4 [Candidatus Nitrosocosmicus franklandus]VFJ14576.1 RNA polymerase Rpb4 [Candidatus Nitrosocosmicus franklandus]